MIKTIDGNKIKASELKISGDGVLPETAILKKVSYMYGTDEKGMKTENVLAVRYKCINPNDFDTFTVKVEATDSIITPAELEAAEEPVFITIPVKETLIKPYKIEYGYADVTIVAPYVTRATVKK